MSSFVNSNIEDNEMPSIVNPPAGVICNSRNRIASASTSSTKDKNRIFLGTYRELGATVLVFDKETAHIEKVVEEVCKEFPGVIDKEPTFRGDTMATFSCGGEPGPLSPCGNIWYMAITSLFGNIGQTITDNLESEILHHKINMKDLMCKQSWEALVMGFCSQLNMPEALDEQQKLAKILCGVYKKQGEGGQEEILVKAIHVKLYSLPYAMKRWLYFTREVGLYISVCSAVPEFGISEDSELYLSQSRKDVLEILGKRNLSIRLIYTFKGIQHARDYGVYVSYLETARSNRIRGHNRGNSSNVPIASEATEQDLITLKHRSTVSSFSHRSSSIADEAPAPAHPIPQPIPFREENSSGGQQIDLAEQDGIRPTRECPRNTMFFDTSVKIPGIDTNLAWVESTTSWNISGNLY